MLQENVQNIMDKHLKCIDMYMYQYKNCQKPKTAYDGNVFEAQVPEILDRTRNLAITDEPCNASIARFL